MRASEGDRTRRGLPHPTRTVLAFRRHHHWHAPGPRPHQVAVMMYDFAFGGIYDDAFSGTILTHIWKSMTRVYGGS